MSEKEREAGGEGMGHGAVCLLWDEGCHFGEIDSMVVQDAIIGSEKDVRYSKL